MRRVLSLLMTVATISLPSGLVGASRVLYEKQSRYHFIRVVESGTLRTLTFRRKGYDLNQSGMDMRDPLKPSLPYYPLMFAGYLFVPRPQRVLVVGLGGGVISRLSAHYFPEAQIHSIELDPDVVDVAKKFFEFQEGQIQKVFIRDARVQIKLFQRQGSRYDIIMLDAFRGGYVPYHLTTREFCEECQSILSPAGALVVNLKPGWIIYQYQRRTLASVFPEQYPFGGLSDDEVVVALPSERNLTRDQLLATAKTLQEQRKFSFSLPDIGAQFNMGPGFPAKGPIFTDAYAPANILRQQLDSPYRRHKVPLPPFARLADWFKRYRFPVISVSALLIIVASAFGKARRAARKTL